MNGSKNSDAAESGREVRNLGDSIVAMGNVGVKDEAKALIDEWSLPSAARHPGQQCRYTTT